MKFPASNSTGGGFKIKGDADRIEARGHGLELIAQHPSDHEDAAVALTRCSSECRVIGPWPTCAS